MRLILSLIFFLIFEVVSAKDFPMLHYTIEDGLPSNTIYDIYQDPDGMIWIGTDKGVSRFNGIKFENFTTADGLSDNECFYFRRDKDGRLWIACYNGQLCFYKDGKFHNEQNTAWLKLPTPNYFREIRLLSDNSIAFYSKNEPDIFVLNGKTFKTIQGRTQIGKSLIIKDVRVVGTKYLIYYSDVITTVQNNKIVQEQVLSTKIKNAFFDQNKTHYLTEGNKVLDSNLSEVDFHSFSKLKDKAIYRLYNNKLHQIIASDKGVFIDNFDAILSNQHIHTTILDKNQDYWIGTKEQGLYIINKQFASQKRIVDAFDSKIIFAATKNDKLVFATTNGDLLRTDDHDSIFCIFNYNHFIKSSKYYFQTLFSIDSNQIINGSEIGNFRMLLYKFMINNTVNKLPVIPKIKNQNLILPNELAKGISDHISTDSSIYFKGRYYLWSFNKNYFFQTRKEYYFKSIKINTNYDAIFGFAINNNSIWISTFKSVYKLVNDTPIEQKQFKSISFREFCFLNNIIVGFSHKNELLICSNFISQNIVVDTIKEQNCIWNKLHFINDSTLLISSNNYHRILTIKRSKDKINYQIKVLENPFIPYQPEYIFSGENKIHFFNKGVISSFPINYVLETKPLPSIKFTTLKTDKSYDNIQDTVSLEYDQSKNLKISFTPISFYHQNLSYEYNISEKGKPGQWNSFTGEELNLIKIGYGNFTIQVRAKTLSGDYSRSAKFVLIVQKPYWATWWFICLLLAVMVLIITIIARMGIKRRLLKKEGEVRFLRSEYKALNALMNPHFIFNSLNSVQSLINNNENTTASKYIRIFSDLIRQNMRNISNELIPLSKELDLVENYLKIEKLRFKEHLNYSIEIGEEVETEMIMIPPLLIQPLVENAIKHGIWPKKSNDGFIQIRIWESGNLLKIDIEDNGNGFASAAKTDTLHESYAMSNIQQRIEQLSQIHSSQITIQIEEKKDDKGIIKGVISTVTIQMPD